MTADQIKDYTLLVVALLPLAGNLLALALRRAGKNSAADWVVRMTPLAVVAASSKTREEAIQVVIREAELLTKRPSNQRLRAHVEIVADEPPPSSSAHLAPMPPKDAA